MTPGTARISANGSRDVGILVSSSAVKFVDVPVARGSTTGDCPETVTVSVLQLEGHLDVFPDLDDNPFVHHCGETGQ
jgi:hypothetical protein